MERTSYQTANRTLILSHFQDNPDMMITVGQLQTYLLEHNKKINPSTIYRYLDKLVSEGIIIKQVADKGNMAAFRFCGDHECEQHLHLTCTSCGQTFHLECDFMHEISHHIADHHHFQLQCKDSVLYGLCQSCADKAKTF